ncbi:MAG: efflux RND transporter periplasmic adaptor subunit [Chromatiaceae bacterium]|jgi:RND family efflux transporter MFP subunit|nr:efflux RND transporter periplasmic adaptor subunit [Chromatiaceae bacterium]
MRKEIKLRTHRTQGRFLIAGGVLVASMLGGCTEQAPPQIEAVARPVKTMVIAGADAAGARSFPARIAAAQRADLAFRVPGTVKEFPVKEGDRLQEGGLVARLDPTDYQIVVDDRRATFDKTNKNYERGKELVDTGAISRSDFDRLEAEFKKAQAALSAATQDLAYTELKAPFEGIIATRLVDQFEEVQAKQAIAVLQNIQMLEVKFDVPESIIRGIRASGEAQTVDARHRVKVFASFQDQPGHAYPLTFKELATKADAKTQTFEATYLMKQWDKGTVLPGMTATVTVDFLGLIDSGISFTVPVSAVVGDYKLDPRVWTVDEASMTVSPRPVKVGRLLGDGIEILDGLEPGARIVTAGTPFLVDGMQVRLMPDLEQAAPRPEDLKYQQ